LDTEIVVAKSVEGAHDEHDHAQGHLHAHAPKSFGFAFAIGVSLNASFVLVEAIFGVIGNSTALLADAAHNLGDVLGLLVAWAAVNLSRRPPTARFTYGLRGSSILAALFNAMILLVAVGGIGWEAVQRIGQPEPVAEMTVIVVALVGIAINGGTALLFVAGRKDDINIQGAFLHMAADAAVSVGVVIAAIIILYTGWFWIDPAVSLVICVVILWGTWGLLKASMQMSLDAVPAGIDPLAVRSFLETRPGVTELHDLHIWPMSTTETALTCHLVMPGGHPGDAFILATARELQHQFRIGHTTLQIETSMATACSLAPEEVV
jgi:cobalt-zinc-cadmium efflux system protein